MIPEEHRTFLESHSLAVIGFARKSGPPSLSPVYYFLDGDEIVFSTTTKRGKGRAVARTGELSLCIVDSERPYAYLTVFGTATMDEATAVDTLLRISEVITGSKANDAVRPHFEQRAQSEGRVSVRIRPTGFVKTDPITPAPRK